MIKALQNSFNIINLSICEDCTFYLQSGELPEKSSVKREAMITINAGRLEETYKILRYSSFNDHATTSCDCCNSRLAGERYIYDAEAKHG